MGLKRELNFCHSEMCIGDTLYPLSSRQIHFGICRTVNGMGEGDDVFSVLKFVLYCNSGPNYVSAFLVQKQNSGNATSETFQLLEKRIWLTGKTVDFSWWWWVLHFFLVRYSAWKTII